MKLSKLLPVVLFAGMLLAFGSLVSGYLKAEDVITKVLNGYNYTEVNVIYAVKGCSRGDGYLFEAKSEGKDVKGVICTFDGNTPAIAEL